MFALSYAIILNVYKGSTAVGAEGFFMQEIFTYTDFRNYIRDALADLKSRDRSYNYRKVADELGIKSPGYITQFLKGDRTLSSKLIDPFSKLFDLKKREAAFFKVLVNYNQERNRGERNKLYARMTELKKRAQTKLEPESYLYFEKWYYSAIRSIIDFVPFDGTNFKDISDVIVPSISEKQVEKAIKVLKKLGLIKKKDDGFYTLADRHLTTGLNSDSVILNNYVLNTTDIAKESLYNFPVNERSFSALTLSVSEECYSEIKEDIAEFRKKILEKVTKDSNTERACQLNIQFFPLSKGAKSEN